MPSDFRHVTLVPKKEEERTEKEIPPTRPTIPRIPPPPLGDVIYIVSRRLLIPSLFVITLVYRGTVHRTLLLKVQQRKQKKHLRARSYAMTQKLHAEKQPYILKHRLPCQSRSWNALSAQSQQHTIQLTLSLVYDFANLQTRPIG